MRCIVMPAIKISEKSVLNNQVYKKCIQPASISDNRNVLYSVKTVIVLCEVVMAWPDMFVYVHIFYVNEKLTLLHHSLQTLL